MYQCDLFANGTPFLADGVTFDREADSARLGRLMAAVERAMGNRQWWTLAGLSRATGGPEASVSARIRDLRKPRFGGHTVERRRCANGLWEYRLTP
jgi:hypothetical protein